jgi:hypothetical protein
MDAKDIKTLFNQFAGKEIAMKRARAHSAQKNPSVSGVTPDLHDPVIQAIMKVSSENGVYVRINGGSSMNPDDCSNTNRVNLYLEKSTNGKYRISNRIEVG